MKLHVVETILIDNIRKACESRIKLEGGEYVTSFHVDFLLANSGQNIAGTYKATMTYSDGTIIKLEGIH
jgi:hypothetical protein